MSSIGQQEIEKIVRQQNDRFEKNFAEGNAAGLVGDYYVPDEMGPLVSAPDAPAMRDRAAITGMFEALVKDFSRARQVSHVIRTDGALAYEVSNSYLTPRAGGDDVEFRYVAVWRRCEDAWRVEADFFAAGPIID